MLKDWNACAQEVARALSRYDGISARVNFGVILSMPASPLFAENSSCHAWELMSEVKAQGVGGRRSAEATLSHGTTLGFLRRVVPGSMKTAKFALSPLGRAYRAALQLKDGQFEHFLKAGALLDNDFDMYGLFLRCALENAQSKADETDFRNHFWATVQQRRDWIDSHISSPVVRERIRRHVQQDLSDKSVKEHFGMRWQWARDLAHADENKTLTESGRILAVRVQSVAKRNSRFWLSPTPECARKIGIVMETPDVMCSGWDLLRPDGQEEDPDEEMIRNVADFMESAFGAIRLRAFAQAPLEAVIPYVHFQETTLRRKVNTRALFRKILEKRRDTMHCMLLGVLEDSQYRLRKISLSTPAARA